MPSAHAEYMADYRRRNPDTFARQRASQGAYRRALRALKAAHEVEFGQLLTLERARVGLEPVGAVRPGPKRKTA